MTRERRGWLIVTAIVIGLITAVALTIADADAHTRAPKLVTLAPPKTRVDYIAPKPAELVREDPPAAVPTTTIEEPTRAVDILDFEYHVDPYCAFTHDSCTTAYP